MRRALNLLLLEDDLVDVTTFRRAVERSGLPVTVEHVRDGIEALRFLRDRHKKTPELILADLRMPRMGGLEFLDAKAADEDVQPVPVVVFTTSKDANDRDASYRRGAGGFISKPSDPQDYAEVVRRIFDYWSLCEPPGCCDAG